MDRPFQPPVRPGYRKRRSSGLPAWLYYAFAALLVLVTVPMYRVILAPHDAASRAPVVAVAPSLVQQAVTAGVERAVAPVQQQSMRNMYELQARSKHLAPAPIGRRMLADEHCVGGSIVRVDQVNGVTTYVQETDGGLPLACPHGVYY